MFQPLSKEALAALCSDDAGFQEYLATLPENERNLVGRVFESPELLNTLIASLPPDQQLATRSLLDTFQDVPDKALALYNQCRFLEARDLLERAISMYELPGGLPVDAIIMAAGFAAQRAKALFYVMLGDVEMTLGNSLKAGEHHRQALELSKQCGDRDAEAKALHGLGCYYWELGDYEQALEYSRHALDLIEDTPDRWSTTGKALNLLSLIHAELSQWDEALQYGDKAIELAENEEGQQSLAIVLNNRTVQLTDLGLLDDVKPIMERALALVIEKGSLRQEAMIRRNMGMYLLNAASDDKDVDAAIICFQKSLEISLRIKAVSPEALTCSGLGYALVMKEEITDAEEHFRRAVELYRGIGAIADQAASLVDLGNLLRFCRNAPENALNCYSEAINLTEQVRSKLKRETHRIGLSEARTEPYQQAITTLLELGRVDEAFHYLERARSKALLELLAGQFSVGGSDEAFRKTAEFAKRIDELRHALDEIQKADETGAFDENEETTRRATMRGEIQQGLEQEELQFVKLCEELQRVSPERHGMVTVQATDSSAVQAILSAGTALVELYQTDEQLLLFVIRRDHPALVVEIELTADDAAEMVFPYILALRDPNTLDIQSHDYLRSVRQPASRLHEAIFGPLEEILDGVQRLVIVPHLFWHYLPFHALYDSKSKQFLLDRFEISYAPSASALVVCKGKQRHRRDSAMILCRNDGDLPHVEAEGIAISKVFDHSSIFHGSEADLGKADCQSALDVIHCACHGYFDPEQPFLSGIAIPPDKDMERPTMLMDLMRLRLETSLVTLSACDTGLSRISNADELVGLSRSFFGAGAAALLLSLWKVADSSTAYLMENFYWHYVANRKTKGRSLQLAMQAVRAKPEYAHPYYWAPFVVMGEWE
ncbi:MAG: CHAT domain-containing protein [Desulfuromonadales bacterium]|nr:CHAT domain-containing protein [Desulfuromonadales bacterium]